MDTAYESRREQMMQDVVDELDRAESNFPPFRSYHEGYAILKEEVDELWDKIKSKEARPVEMYGEAIQVAAMAVRFMILCYEKI